MLVIPIAFMFLLTMYAVMYTGETYEGSSGNYTATGEINMSSEDEEASVSIPSGGSHSFNIWSLETGGALLIITTAMAVGIVAGVTVLGSGLKEFSQTLIFNGIMFLGTWACLSVVAGPFLFIEDVGIALWFVLTFMFMIGLGMHMTAAGGGGD